MSEEKEGAEPAEPIETTVIADVGDLVEVSTRMPGRMWWRGHARVEWKLTPKLFRLPYNAQAEQSLIAGFGQRARTRHANCPAGDARAAWLFLAQHYGLPTRLLDWTESALLGLYFAVAESEHEDATGCLWAMNPFGVNEQMLGKGKNRLFGSSHAQSRRVLDKPFSGRDDNEEVVVALVTDEVDLRMLVQLSGLTAHGSPTPLEDVDKLRPYLRMIEIPGDRKPHLRQQLAGLGIRSRTVFPDLEHLAQDLTTGWKRKMAEELEK